MPARCRAAGQAELNVIKAAIMDHCPHNLVFAVEVELACLEHGAVQLRLCNHNEIYEQALRSY